MRNLLLGAILTLIVPASASATPPQHFLAVESARQLGEADTMGPTVVVRDCQPGSCLLTVDRSARERVTLWSDGSLTDQWSFKTFTGRAILSQHRGAVCARWVAPPWKKWLTPVCTSISVLRSYIRPLRLFADPKA